MKLTLKTQDNFFKFNVKSEIILDLNLNYCLVYDGTSFECNVIEINYFQGHQIVMNASRFSFFLPSCSFVEKRSAYWNIFGGIQYTNKIFLPSSNSFTDWQICLSISVQIKQFLFDKILHRQTNKNKFFSIKQQSLVILSELYSPIVSNNSNILSGTEKQIFSLFNFSKKNIFISPLLDLIDNYYQIDSVSKLSKMMALCAQTSVLRKFL